MSRTGSIKTQLPSIMSTDKKQQNKNLKIGILDDLIKN